MPPRRPESSSKDLPETPFRFRGLSEDSRIFFENLERDPCPDAWSGGNRVAYAAHVLSPLKALASDLGRLLDDVSPRVTFDPRVGGSLGGTGLPDRSGEDCPVRLIRGWDADSTPERSPLLYACFSGGGIEVGVWAAGGDPAATRRVADDWRDGDEAVRAITAGLEAFGWRVTGTGGPGSSPAASPDGDGSDAWDVVGGLRVFRALDWASWLHEATLVLELADRFRELLPLFDRMRGGADPAHRVPTPEAAVAPERRPA